MRRATRPAAGHPRGGFTLVELLVAAALSLVVMTVLSLAFQTGLQTLSNLKSVVGLAEQMRAAEGVIRRDLAAYHLEDSVGQPVLVSQNQGNAVRGYIAFSQGGYAQPTPAGAPVALAPQQEGVAENGLASFRTASAQNFNHQNRAWMDCIAFTTRLKGDGPQEIYTASAGPAVNNLVGRLVTTDASALPPEAQSADPTGTQFASRWAEVGLFLKPAGPPGSTSAVVFTSDEGNVTPLPLYTLYRRQRVLASRTVTPTGANALNLAIVQDAPGVAAALGAVTPAVWSVLGPEGLVNPANRLGGANDALAPAINAALPPLFQQDLARRPYPILTATSPEFGSDVVLNNVVSMTVRPVFSHRVPQAVLDYMQANSIPLSTAVILSPDGVTADRTTLEFADYSPRNLLFPNVIPGNGAGGYGDPAQYPRFYSTGGGGFNGTFLVNGNPVAPPSAITGFKLKAVEIKLRVYDQKNKTTRQMTILQDL